MSGANSGPIDFTRYEGHTPAPWRLGVPRMGGYSAVDSGKGWNNVLKVRDGTYLEWRTLADENLMLDAPVLLAQLQAIAGLMDRWREEADAYTQEGEYTLAKELKDRAGDVEGALHGWEIR